MAKNILTKNKFKGSLETVFTDVVCYKNELEYEYSDNSYYNICTDIWGNFPSEFPKPIIGPVPLQISSYDNELRPFFNKSPNSNYLWPVLITPSGCAAVNEQIEDNSGISSLKYPLSPYADARGFKLGRTHIFIGSEKIIEKYPDIYYFKKYPQFWKKVWYICLDMALYGLDDRYVRVVCSKSFQQYYW